MTAFTLARGALAFIAHAAIEFCRPHRCQLGCEFRTHDIHLMGRHYEDNHAGDPLPTKEHAR